MSKFTAPLNNNRGSSVLFASGLVVGLALILFVISTFLEYYTITQAVTDNLQASTLTVITNNFDETYFSKREAASGGFVRAGDWQEKVDSGNVTEQLKNTMNLTQDGDRLSKLGNGASSKRYEIYDIQVNVSNSAFKEQDTFIINGSCKLSVPLPIKIGLPPFEININTRAAWKEKY